MVNNSVENAYQRESADKHWMKGHVFQHLKSALRSLEASTYLQATTDAVMMTVRGRCSPYISHMDVAFGRPESPPNGLLHLANGRRTLIIEPCNNEGEEALTLEQDDLVWRGEDADIPRTLLAGFEEIMLDLGVELKYPLVRVRVFIPVLVGWGEDGIPLYQKVPT